VEIVFSDFEKEENWLNYMASKGLAMTYHRGWKYKFDGSEPGEYIYKRRSALKHMKSQLLPGLWSSSLTKCGISSMQKKQILDMESILSHYRSTRRLGRWRA